MNPLRRIKAWFTDPDYVWTVGPFGMPMRLKTHEAHMREVLKALGVE